MVTPFVLHRCASLVSFQQKACDIPPNQWTKIVQAAIEHGLGPILLGRLKQDDLDMQANPDFDLLIRSAHQTAAEYMLKEKSQQEIDAAFRQASIPALWLKGAALARTVYPEPTLRPMADLDVLVPYEKREKALEVASCSGYGFYTRNLLKPRNSGDELALKLSHEYHLKGGVADSVILELHFRLLSHNDDLLSLEHIQWFWAQNQTLRLDDGAVFDTLTFEAHLLYLCAHATLQHGEANLYLLRFFDLHQIITQIELNWGVLVDQAVVLGWTSAVERALRLSMEYFATPVPAAVLDALVSRRPAHEDVSRVARLTGAGNRWERVGKNLQSLPLRDKYAFVFLLMFPARSYMHQRYNIKAGWPTWPYYFYRWFDQSRDVAWSMWKRLTGQYR